tara:strand:+ start:1295 stop:1816 length:522 start_codon:yes stop_codon:yes gene_type:complete
MNIVLLGYRGTGKSTIARIVSKRLHRRLFSIDTIIAKTANSSIHEIVKKHGWPGFRQMETEHLKSLAKRYNNAVIDCGGGAVLNPENIHLLKQQGRVVCLTADMEEILKRIKKDPNRPPLKEGISFEEEQKLVMLEREPLYRAAADMIYDTTQTSADETASKIIRFFRDNRWI